MKINWKKLLVCLAVPLAVGGLAALLSGGMDLYKELERPPLSPPGWIFPVVWSILYLLMGCSAYRVLGSGGDEGQIRRALILCGIQLFTNFLWPLLFFRGQLYLSALILLTALWILIFLTIRAFSALDELAGDLLIPYILWVSFAWYLNLGIFLLN